MLFWTVGGKQVGKAAISGWRDVLVRGIRDNRLDVAVWPFDGELVDLIRPRRIVIAETYPAEFYRHLKVTFRRGAPGEQSGKRSQAGRAKNAGALIEWAMSNGIRLHPVVTEKLRDGFGLAESGEDPFDATVGLFGMLNVVLGRRPPGEPTDPQIRKIEGWILGQELPSGT